ncbi:conserved hypothetical protein [Desulfosarcina cetonica]|uniref:SHOCT domain-containing protein n=1 Tax=Desulfosarcina cetonica TaxID=90730 RepID=UPI0006D18AC2|nr:SHOCT domain-containing protein [Desulfosarcina cetonica]VTR69317.1 conserved hypothetical protein [Desulfosarcina cetonica]
MNRKTSTLMSLGISVALIVGAIWFLYDQHRWFGYGGGGWYMPYQSMMGGYGGGYMGIFMLLFWVVIIAAIVLAVSGVFSGQSSSRGQLPPPPNAMDVLKRRYASGELDRDQYEAMKKDIEQ